MLIGCVRIGAEDIRAFRIDYPWLLDTETITGITSVTVTPAVDGVHGLSVEAGIAAAGDSIYLRTNTDLVNYVPEVGDEYTVTIVVSTTIDPPLIGGVDSQTNTDTLRIIIVDPECC